MCKLQKALEYLYELLKQGFEYPDAEYRASLHYKVDPVKLTQLYDETEVNK